MQARELSLSGLGLCKHRHLRTLFFGLYNQLLLIIASVKGSTAASIITLLLSCTVPCYCFNAGVSCLLYDRGGWKDRETACTLDFLSEKAEVGKGTEGWASRDESLAIMEHSDVKKHKTMCKKHLLCLIRKTWHNNG